MNNKQTAVEWLIEQLHYKYGGTDFFWTNMDEIEKAKEMEKQQIRKAYCDGEYYKDTKLTTDYYEQTYGAGEQ